MSENPKTVDAFVVGANFTMEPPSTHPEHVTLTISIKERKTGREGQLIVYPHRESDRALYHQIIASVSSVDLPYDRIVWED